MNYDNAFERIMYKRQSYTERVKFYNPIIQISREIQINFTYDFSSYVPQTKVKNTSRSKKNSSYPSSSYRNCVEIPREPDVDT